MGTAGTTTPRWIIARLGDDLNWWIEETSQELDAEHIRIGLLDPRQVAELLRLLPEYRAHGLDPVQCAAAFQPYLLEAELDDGRVRLARSPETITEAGEQSFALPLIEEEGSGGYHDFLDALSAARIRLLNATYHYRQPLTELEMTEELQALDTDRFFGGEAIHAFDELNEILQWRPGEWDEAAN